MRSKNAACGEEAARKRRNCRFRWDWRSKPGVNVNRIAGDGRKNSPRSAGKLRVFPDCSAPSKNRRHFFRSCSGLRAPAFQQDIERTVPPVRRRRVSERKDEAAGRGQVQPMRHGGPQYALRAAALAGNHQHAASPPLLRGRNELVQGHMRLRLSHAVQIDCAFDRQQSPPQPSQTTLVKAGGSAMTEIPWRCGRYRQWGGWIRPTMRLPPSWPRGWVGRLSHRLGLRRRLKAIVPGQGADTAGDAAPEIAVGGITGRAGWAVTRAHGCRRRQRS